MDTTEDLFSVAEKNGSEKNTASNVNSQSKDMKETSTKKSRVSTPKISAKQDGNYTAKDIEVLEGLEPVRRRPGMYVGGTDEKALHHLFAEVIDNSMDEAVAGHANLIEIHLSVDGYLTVTDNGRGIPIDPHPNFKDKSALEVIMTTLHAGGKFDSDVYETAGGLHGVGVSVVNALSEELQVEVARDRKLYRQEYQRGIPKGNVEFVSDVQNRRGTTVKFKPDHEIFGENLRFNPKLLYNMARSKAYLYGGVKIRWTCAPELLTDDDSPQAEAQFHFPGGLSDYLGELLQDEKRVVESVFAGKSQKKGQNGSVEWAISWFAGDGFINSYCNTVPTREGGTHETGLRTALLRGIKAYGKLVNNKKVNLITSEDILTSAGIMLSAFIREPEFVGQTKDKLASSSATRTVEYALRDEFDHWLTESPNQANKLLDWIIDRAEERLRRRQERDVARKSAVRKLRLPGKLADCSASHSGDTELFIVEGDSAGGSAKQARNRVNQAVLPLRGKILNVANAGRDKFLANQQLADLIQALGCGTRSNYSEEDLRYEKIVIMTDADVDGAHIASLLLTFFFREMPELIANRHLYLAVPPLYRINQGGKTLYARDDAHKDEILKKEFNGRGKIEISRFKGLGEMMPAQLKDTTMNPKNRTLLQVLVAEVDSERTQTTVEQLMGNKPEARFQFIQENAEFALELDI